jgi:hypothetical protein
LVYNVYDMYDVYYRYYVYDTRGGSAIMAERGRKKVFQSKDAWAVVVSLRVPRDVYDQVQRYLKMHPRMTLTEFILDGIRLRLETPADPRDVILSDDNTVTQELQEMIRAEVQAEIGKLQDFMGSAFDALKLAPAPEASTEPVSEQTQENHTVVQESARQTAVPDYDEEERPVPQPVPASSTAFQPERREPAVKMPPALTEDIVKIVEARRQHPDIAERAFTQLLFDRGIYRHQVKDGSEVPLPHSTLRDWLQRAREAGVL